MDCVKMSAASFNRIMKMAKVMSAPYGKTVYGDNNIVRLVCTPREIRATALTGASMCTVWEPALDCSCGEFTLVMPVVTPIRKVKAPDTVIVVRSDSGITVTVPTTDERYELEIPEGYSSVDPMKLYPNQTPEAAMFFSPKLLADALSTFDPSGLVKIEFVDENRGAVITDCKRTQKALVMPARDPDKKDEWRRKYGIRRK